MVKKLPIVKQQQTCLVPVVPVFDGIMVEGDVLPTNCLDERGNPEFNPMPVLTATATTLPPECLGVKGGETTTSGAASHDKPSCFPSCFPRFSHLMGSARRFFSGASEYIPSPSPRAHEVGLTCLGGLAFVTVGVVCFLSGKAPPTTGFRGGRGDY